MESNITNSYEINTTITGIPVAVKPYNENSNKKGAQLQFIKITKQGLTKIDVKIQASREEDLQKFVNQKIKISNVNILQIEYNTFYSCDDKSLISLIK
jgi:hypothetical protein